MGDDQVPLREDADRPSAIVMMCRSWQSSLQYILYNQHKVHLAFRGPWPRARASSRATKPGRGSKRTYLPFVNNQPPSYSYGSFRIAPTKTKEGSRRQKARPRRAELPPLITSANHQEEEGAGMLAFLPLLQGSWFTPMRSPVCLARHSTVEMRGGRLGDSGSMRDPASMVYNPNDPYDPLGNAELFPAEHPDARSAPHPEYFDGRPDPCATEHPEEYGAVPEPLMRTGPTRARQIVDRNRRGGSSTGTAQRASSAPGKHSVQDASLSTDVAPAARKVAVIYEPNDPYNPFGAMHAPPAAPTPESAPPLAPPLALPTSTRARLIVDSYLKKKNSPTSAGQPAASKHKRKQTTSELILGGISKPAGGRLKSALNVAGSGAVMHDPNDPYNPLRDLRAPPTTPQPRPTPPPAKSLSKPPAPAQASAPIPTPPPPSPPLPVPPPMPAQQMVGSHRRRESSTGIAQPAPSKRRGKQTPTSSTSRPILGGIATSAGERSRKALNVGDDETVAYNPNDPYDPFGATPVPEPLIGTKAHHTANNMILTPRAKQVAKQSTQGGASMSADVLPTSPLDLAGKAAVRYDPNDPYNPFGAIPAPAPLPPTGTKARRRGTKARRRVVDETAHNVISTPRATEMTTSSPGIHRMPGSSLSAAVPPTSALNLAGKAAAIKEALGLDSTLSIASTIQKAKEQVGDEVRGNLNEQADALLDQLGCDVP